MYLWRDKITWESSFVDWKVIQASESRSSTDLSERLSSRVRLDAAKAEAAVANKRAGFLAKSAERKNNGRVRAERTRESRGRERPDKFAYLIFQQFAEERAEKEDGKDKANSRETPGLTWSFHANNVYFILSNLLTSPLRAHSLLRSSFRPPLLPPLLSPAMPDLKGRS